MCGAIGPHELRSIYQARIALRPALSPDGTRGCRIYTAAGSLPPYTTILKSSGLRAAGNGHSRCVLAAGRATACLQRAAKQIAFPFDANSGREKLLKVAYADFRK